MRFGVHLKDKMFNPSISFEADYFEKKANGDLVFTTFSKEDVETDVGLVLHGQWYAVKAFPQDPTDSPVEEEKHEDQP